MPRLRERPSRRGVARDTLTILGGGLLAVLLVNLTGLGAPMLDPASPTPPDSGIVVARSGVPLPTLPRLDTIGPIVNGSVGIEATPTPIPIITLGPPTPSPSVDASASVGPSPSPTPVPATADFACSVLPGLQLACTDKSTGATAWTWDWGDGTTSTGKGPFTHQYADPYPTPVTVILTVKPGTNRTSTKFFILEPATPPPPPPPTDTPAPST